MLGFLVIGVLPRQGILRALTVRDDNVKIGEEQRPTLLSMFQKVCFLEKGQILDVISYNIRMFSSLQPVEPFIKSLFMA